MKQASQTHSFISGRNARPFVMQSVTDSAVMALQRIGLHFDPSIVHQQVQLLAGGSNGFVGDAAFTAPVTTASIPTPIQFLQSWLPGFVKILTAARKIDDIVGIKTVGNWEDQEIVQGIVEPAATATEYGDYTNIPLASWNTSFERRTIVRGELGMSVGLLEEGRTAAMRLSSSDTKRQSAAIGLEIMRNAIGFFGWNNGLNRTFGFLNDPNLPAFATTTIVGGWANATFQQITGEIRAAIAALRSKSQDNIDPQKVELTLALPTTHVDFLSITTDFGVSVRDWITQTYPKLRIVSAPELSAVQNGGDVDACFYLFAENVDSSIDGSTDGGQTFAQLVQTKFMTLGVEKRAKSYVEDYSNATAGVLCTRPWAVHRVIGI
ncbi:capsid and scaffold protein [Xanthomonas phage Carpasina]|uniref:Capsid and scaffold protein n=1 Tax=Xanthomonas phage Carpasina TaxID=2163636 RepID=A0A2S1GSM4_9CAUD|nr:major head protein [Xanthomonas phage Carpasina]AWD92405.1 capsid and scaffold protein [Xanthomonas phage Carpasina]